ncbi:sensor domain-containing diguanylate cyclase [Methylocaldum sp.]|uniref:sensor domain-containing diguanylate cyclase n=1 Tax=Methylocaldum sp. TaxID=1969727 RepID=UPI002D28555A|nr:sensor domain-containing diguanylate cyclase [Methylocaldum sp.]HYE35153.1 sensor domain-containing diguanylate cyclase [Methylocaldum sp.]
MQTAFLLRKGIIELIVKRFSLYALLTICWLLIACAGLAFAVFLDIQRETQRFSENSALIQKQLVSQTRRYVDAAHSLAAFLKVQEPVNQEKVSTYTRLIAEQNAGIYFMGAVQNLEREGLDEFMALRHHESAANDSSAHAFSYVKNNLTWQAVPNKPVLRSLTSVEPYNDKTRPLLGFEFDSVPLLRDAFQRALQSRGITASHSFLLSNGDWGYALIEPVDLRGEVSFAVVICRVKALLQLPSDSVSLALTLFESAREGASLNDGLIHRQALPVTSLESALFPKLLFRSSLGEPEKFFVLEIEQQLGWADLDWHRLNLIFVGSLAFLFVFFGVARIHDRYERRKFEEGNRLFLMANFDPLTGLPNRQLFMNRLEQALITAHRSRQKVALLYLDLDGFKQINDYYGHQTGDKVLQRAARIFQHSIRETDTVGRLGGDEFVVLLQNVGDLRGAESVANKIKKAFRQPSAEANGINKALPILGTSVGIAVYPEDGSTTAELLRTADQAMYQDKAVSKGQQSPTAVLESLDCHPAPW